MDTGNGILQGAQITVDPEGATAVADIQGQFLVVGLNPGRYTVTVTYAGFAPTGVALMPSLNQRESSAAAAAATGRSPPADRSASSS